MLLASMWVHTYVQYVQVYKGRVESTATFRSQYVHKVQDIWYIPEGERVLELVGGTEK